MSSKAQRFACPCDGLQSELGGVVWNWGVLSTSDIVKPLVIFPWGYPPDSETIDPQWVPPQLNSQWVDIILFAVREWTIWLAGKSHWRIAGKMFHMENPQAQPRFFRPGKIICNSRGCFMIFPLATLHSQRTKKFSLPVRENLTEKAEPGRWKKSKRLNSCSFLCEKLPLSSHIPSNYTESYPFFYYKMGDQNPNKSGRFITFHNPYVDPSFCMVFLSTPKDDGNYCCPIRIDILGMLYFQTNPLSQQLPPKSPSNPNLSELIPTCSNSNSLNKQSFYMVSDSFLFIYRPPGPKNPSPNIQGAEDKGRKAEAHLHLLEQSL